jgi:hypothetical protein
MKKLIFLLFIQSAFSQIEKNIGDFQELKVLDGINVVLEKGEQNALKITGDNTENVVITNKSGTLIIKMQLIKKLKGQNTVVKLTHKSRIFLIEAKEGATIFSKEKTKQSTIYLKTASGGQIDLEIQTEKVTATAKSGGIINLKGSTFSFDAIVKSGSIVKANELNSSQTKVKASSGGSCKAFARDIFEADASLGGLIEVHGDPKTFNQVVSLGGNIIETNND